MSPGDSLSLTDISESLALNPVNPDFTPCRVVLDRKVTGRAQSKQSVAYSQTSENSSAQEYCPSLTPFIANIDVTSTTY